MAQIVKIYFTDVMYRLDRFRVDNVFRRQQSSIYVCLYASESYLGVQKSQSRPQAIRWMSSAFGRGV